MTVAGDDGFQSMFAYNTRYEYEYAHIKRLCNTRTQRSAGYAQGHSQSFIHAENAAYAFTIPLHAQLQRLFGNVRRCYRKSWTHITREINSQLSVFATQLSQVRP